MAEEIQIDWLAVFVAAFMNIIINVFWYSKWLFRKEWMQLSSVTGKEMGKNKYGPLYAVVLSLLLAFFLAFFEAHLSITTVSDGVFVGFCAWLGFSFTTDISSVIWSQKPFRLFLINSGCRLLSFLVMGGIIGA